MLNQNVYNQEKKSIERLTQPTSQSSYVYQHSQSIIQISKHFSPFHSHLFIHHPYPSSPIPLTTTTTLLILTSTSGTFHRFRSLSFPINPLIFRVKASLSKHRPLRGRRTHVVSGSKLLTTFKKLEELFVVDEGMPATINEKAVGCKEDTATTIQSVKLAIIMPKAGWGVGLTYERAQPRCHTRVLFG